MTDTLYAALHRAGCELSHHETDLYVRPTPDAMEIIKAHEARGVITNRKPFRADDGSGVWLELPFHYDPGWNRRG